MSRGGGHIEDALRGYHKRNSRERKELTDPNLAVSHVEAPDDLSSETYGPRNPSIKAQLEPHYTKAEVNFQHPAKGRDDCDECVHWLGPDKPACELVQGKVEHEDWCRKFELDRAKAAHEIEEEEEEEHGR